MHSIEYDETHDEIIVPQQFGQAILTFRGDANGEDEPLRVIQGSLTQLRAPDRLALDPVNEEIFVPEDEKVLVFPRTANGNVAPIRILGGGDSRLTAKAVAVDTENDLLIVSERPEWGKAQISIFDRTAVGDAKPKAVIAGPKTRITSTRNVRVYNDWILVAQDGRQLREGMQPAGSFVAVFHISDNGNVAPRWTIGGPDGTLQKPRGIALDPEHKTVIVSDKFLNSVLTYSLPQLYAENE